MWVNIQLNQPLLLETEWSKKNIFVAKKLWKIDIDSSRLCAFQSKFCRSNPRMFYGFYIWFLALVLRSYVGLSIQKSKYLIFPACFLFTGRFFIGYRFDRLINLKHLLGFHEQHGYIKNLLERAYLEKIRLLATQVLIIRKIRNKQGNRIVRQLVTNTQTNTQRVPINWKLFN